MPTVPVAPVNSPPAPPDIGEKMPDVKAVIAALRNAAKGK